MIKEAIISTGGTGMVGDRIRQVTRGVLDWGVDLDIRTGVDITDPAQVDEAIGNSPGRVILHLAAFTDVNKAWEQRGDINGSCYRVNVLGTRNVARVAARYGKHLVHVSTDFVFGGETDLPYLEDSATNPVEWYGQTKLSAEEEVQQVGGSHTIVRIGFPYRASYAGKGDYIRNTQTALLVGSLPPQFTDNINTPTFVDDIAQAIKVIVEHRPSGIFHVVGSSSLSSYELARKVAGGMGIDPDIVDPGSFVDYYKRVQRFYPRFLRVSNALAVGQLGLRLRDVDSGLEELFYQRGNNKR